jgi:glyoxylase-like metal-dependent hydrolase (beta-lactamase superfamily II)
VGGKAIADGRIRVANNHIAFLKVKELERSLDSLQLQNSDTAKYTVIKRFNNQRVHTGDYYFDRQTKLLEKVTSHSSGQAVTLRFSHYKKQMGRVDNQLVTLTTNDKINYEEKIVVSKVNFVFDTALLAVPKGYTLNKTIPPSKPLAIAKDVYLIERLAGDRNVVFVNMDDHIVVIEAPVSTDLSKQVIQMIREVVPGKPIKYVFTTHFHSDHTGGLRQYAFEGAQFIMAAPTQAYVKDLLSTTPADDWTKSGRALPEMITINGKYILQDANHTIEFYEVPNSHAQGMALAYFPKEKIIYQGDLLSVPLDGTLPYGIEVTQDMQRFLKKEQMIYSRMVGHHGHNHITPVMVDRILQRKPVSIQAKRKK